jgi:hypothetical protein
MLLERRATAMEQRHDETRRDGVARYEVTGNPHPIQARKAWEDNDTWMAGTLLGFEDGVATVAFGDGEAPAAVTGLRIGGPVWVTERWGVLAFADEDGNAVAIRPVEEMDDSIFTRIGHGRLRFVTIRLAGTPQEDPEQNLTGFVHGTGRPPLQETITRRPGDVRRGGAK